MRLGCLSTTSPIVSFAICVGQMALWISRPYTARPIQTGAMGQRSEGNRTVQEFIIMAAVVLASQVPWEVSLARTAESAPPSATMSAFAPSRGLARLRALLLVSGLASCTGSPATIALQPAFQVMTPAGPASVSIREAPPGMTDAEFIRLVRQAMQAGAHGSVIPRPVRPPFPVLRIVWHVEPSDSRGMSQVTVNVFNGARPFAYEQERVDASAPTMVLASAVQSMCQRLLSDMAAQANMRT